MVTAVYPETPGHTCGAEGGGERPARLALHRGDGGDHGAAWHHGSVHLHPLGGGGCGRQPGAHLAGLQVRELQQQQPG